MKIAVLFHRLGPYHHARLKAAARLGPLSAIELTLKDSIYDWEVVSGAEGFERLTLFKEDSKAKKAGVIKNQLNKVLRQVNPDVVAIPGWGNSWTLAALHCCLKMHMPAILMSESTYHDAPRKLWIEYIKKRIIRLFGAAIVGGSQNARYLKMLGFPKKRLFLGYDVVDNAHFRNGADLIVSKAAAIRKKLRLPERFFLASGRFVEKKNQLRLLQAYALYVQYAGDDSMGLVLLGDGPLHEQIQTIIQELNLSKRVHLPGFKQHVELPSYYGLAAVFIHPSTTEQWGLVVNEAMAAGLPLLISNRCGCAPDLVREGVNGFTFDPYDIEKMACLMLKVSRDRYNWKSMGKASREIISRWAPETFAENLWKAGEMAHSTPCPKATLFDKLLLLQLMKLNFGS